MKRAKSVRTGRWAIILFLATILLAGAAPPSGAVPGSNGAVDGVITCEGNPVQGVVVSVIGPAPSTTHFWTGTTNASGRYYTDMIVPPGNYTVRHYYNLGICQYEDMAKSASVQAEVTTTVNFQGTLCADGVQNGSFEDDAFPPWILGETPWPAGYSTTEHHSGNRSMRSGIEPPNADRVTESSFYQAISIPAEAASATLTFWYRPRTEETVSALSAWQDVSWAGYDPARSLAGETVLEELQAEALASAEAAGVTAAAWYYRDWQEVLVLDQGYRLLEVLQRELSDAGTGGWIYRQYDLTPYRGRTIHVYFNSINAGGTGKRTWMFVDDVTVRTCSQPPACSVTPTNQWINLYGLESTFQGAPLAPGQIVEAYDPDGVLAGCFVVASSGRYGAMAVYGDDSETPEDEGGEPGDTLGLMVDGQAAAVLGPDTPVWTENGALRHVELAVGGTITRSISLRTGWNLISFDVMPSDTRVETVLAPIAGQFTRVLGSTCELGALSYYPDLPAGMNTLTRMDPYHGYWIFMTTAATLPVAGPELPDSVPIDLCARWNLVSYLPDGKIRVPDALYSIAKDYAVVLGFKQGALSYYTALPPDMNSLKDLEPTYGYWIRATAETVLSYPRAGMGLMASSQAIIEPAPLDSNLRPTYLWADAYSLGSEYLGAPVPVGAVIAAFDPDGVKVGSFVVTQEGRYGPMPIYGDDPATPEDEGVVAGDRLSFTINGERAYTVPARPTWRGAMTLMQIDLITRVR